MKVNYTKTSLTVIVLLSIFIMANSSAPPAGRTGAPGEGMCSACHGGNNPLGLDGDILINGVPDQVNPGSTYELEVLLRNPNGLAQRGGFQLVVLDENNENIGSFGNPSQGSRTRNFSGRTYFEHNPAQNFPAENLVSWTVEWTIPEDSEATKVNIYTSGLIADGNGGTSRDFYVRNELSANVVTTNVNDLSFESITLYPNPAADWINFKGYVENTLLDYQIIDYSGKLHLSGQFLKGDNIDISSLPTASYFITLRNNEKIEVLKFQKIQ
ncbi:MAG: T9SS C-terminal target domain-containing protein [Saprospirales bacterium]|nr:MAG: T9SS C-terminal target domain-containing protein [Saprospirales bacterium]